MGFGEKLLSWMDSCIFTSHTSIIINEALRKDFRVKKGLCQGDPLSPFLFVLVTRALTGLMKRALERVDFKGFKINEVDEVNLLQFTDATIIVVNGCSDNFWMMKSMLRGFELMTGTKINFLKSKLYGIHVSDSIMEAASNFLNYDIDVFPFKYLSVKVGAIPRNVSIWKDLISQLKSKVSKWRGRHLNMAGRVTLINSVLNAIQIYTLFLQVL
ncbi:uncharacterized protein LOC131628077 [Vicia villosa]|uniref:uncharacterized protein LOC131628077 n=1 Tax=Vicia villosa TaxID=3911 RepID=UPI00273C47A2|nr:uncharacterized protein LOC131628077 [Vicia villosa]